MIKYYIIVCLNTSKPTRVEVTTYSYESFAKDGKKMKIPQQDSWYIYKSWVVEYPFRYFVRESLLEWL